MAEPAGSSDDLVPRISGAVAVRCSDEDPVVSGVVPHPAAEVNETRVFTAPVPGSVSRAHRGDGYR